MDKSLSSPQRLDRIWGPRPVQWILGAISLRVKQPGNEAGHSPPSSVEVKNE
jgi:hypothetical protein